MSLVTAGAKWVWLTAFLLAVGLAAGCGDRRETSAPVPTAEPVAASGGAQAAGVGRPQGGALPVTLIPAFPTVEDALQAVVCGGSGTLFFRWERNGEAISGQSAAHLPPHSFVKGDTVTVAVESGEGEARSSTTIANSPPKVISVPFVEPHVRHGADIIARPQGVDVDGDPLKFRYLWSIDGSEVIGNDSPRLPGDRFRKGDRIGLTVIPSDDEGEGQPFNGSEFTVPNAPPIFVSSPSLEFRARVYAYEARAEDPDGDPLTYSLESGPPGMTIDGGSGGIRWELKPENSGEHRIIIVAQDDEGMRAIQEFTLNLSIPE